jgi:hypothetical protein
MSLGHFQSDCFHSKTWFSKARLILSAQFTPPSMVRFQHSDCKYSNLNTYINSRVIASEGISPSNLLKVKSLQKITVKDFPALVFRISLAPL